MNKASGGDGIPVELFQILKDDAVKVLHSVCQQIWKTQQWPQNWKRSVFISIPKKGNVKECSNYCTLSLISHTTKVMLKFSKPGFSNTWTVNFQMFKLVLEKAEEPKIKLPTSTGSWKKQERSRKTSISALLTIPKPLCSVQFSCSVLSTFLWPHESQHASPPCPSPTPRVHSNSCPSSRWCHTAISSSVVPFSSCLHQHQGLFQRVSSSHEVAKILEFQLQHQSLQWIFRTDFF